MDEAIKNTGILILEDSPTFRLKLKTSLERNGFTHLFLAENGKEGLEEIKRNPEIDFCVVDLEMPIMTGFEFLENLYSSPEYERFKNIPSIILSSLEKKEDIIRALELGASDYLHKKYSNEELIVRVTAQLRLVYLIRERESLQQQVALENERMKLETMKTNFIDTLTHELKTPLTNIFGLASLLHNSLATRLSEEENELFRDLDSESEQLNEIISKLIEINQLKHGEGSGEVAVESINLNEMLNEMMPLLEKEKGEKRIELIVDFPDDAVSLYGNPDVVQKVLLECSKNAIKFIKRRGAIRFTSYVDGAKIAVQIADTGIGIDDEKKESVFDLFYQVDDSSTRKFGGTGTGLYLCQMLLENMGEKIWFSDNEPKGAILNFTQQRG